MGLWNILLLVNATSSRRLIFNTVASTSSLLQHIIETISGQSLRDFARENLFDVLGMEHTDYLPCQRDKDGNWITIVDKGTRKQGHKEKQRSQFSIFNSQFSIE